MADGASVWTEITTGVRPRFVAWVIDLLAALMLWASIGILHFVQLFTLRWGWSVTIVHDLDFLEEAAVFATVFTYFFGSLLSYLYFTFLLVRSQYRRNAR